MNKLILIIIVLLVSVFSSHALTLEGVTVNSSQSNTSITFDRSMTMDSVVLGNDSVILYNVSFTGVSSFYLNETDTANEFTSLTFDTANSSTNSETLLIKLRFYDTLMDSYVEDYSFGEFTSSNPYTYIYYTGLNGSYSEDFIKTGYRASSHSFNIVQGSDNDFTFNVKGNPETVAIGNILYVIVGIIIVTLGTTVLVAFSSSFQKMANLLEIDYIKLILMILLLGLIVGVVTLFTYFADTVTSLF